MTAQVKHADLERQLQQFSVHAVLLSQTHAMIHPLCFAKIMHCFCHLNSNLEY